MHIGDHRACRGTHAANDDLKKTESNKCSAVAMWMKGFEKGEGKIRVWKKKKERGSREQGRKRFKGGEKFEGGASELRVNNFSRDSAPMVALNVGQAAASEVCGRRTMNPWETPPVPPQPRWDPQESHEPLEEEDVQREEAAECNCHRHQLSD